MAYTTLPLPGSGGGIRIRNPFALLGLRGSATLGHDLAWVNSNLHGKTNKWARYKPEAIGGPGPITDAMRAGNNYALAPSDAGILSGLSLNAANILRIAALRWNYTAPAPGVNWARLTDWDGYDHAAVPPMVPPGDVTVLFGDTSASFMLLGNSIRTGANLTIEDFIYNGVEVSDFYLCVIIFRIHKTSGAYDILLRQTADKTIGTGGREIPVDITSLRSLANPAQYAGLKYLLCLTDLKISPSENKTASPKMWPLVTYSAPIASLVIDTDSPFRVTVTGVASRGSTPVKFRQISAYYGPVAMGGVADYFGVAEGMWLRATVENRTDVSRVLRDTTLRLVTTHNLATPDGNTEEIEIAFGDGLYRIEATTYTQIASITIPAGSSVDLILDASRLPMSKPGVGVVATSARSHTTMSATIRHITDSSSFTAPAGTLNIRIHDGKGTKSF